MPESQVQETASAMEGAMPEHIRKAHAKLGNLIRQSGPFYKSGPFWLTVLHTIDYLRGSTTPNAFDDLNESSSGQQFEDAGRSIKITLWKTIDRGCLSVIEREEDQSLAAKCVYQIKAIISEERKRRRALRKAEKKKLLLKAEKKLLKDIQAAGLRTVEERKMLHAWRRTEKELLNRMAHEAREEQKAEDQEGRRLWGDERTTKRTRMAKEKREEERKARELEDLHRDGFCEEEVLEEKVEIIDGDSEAEEELRMWMWTGWRLKKTILEDE